jgi:site-specific DNA-adenine methylase
VFYYYGGKRRLAKRYPAPRHDVIVEPFAGSAAYALRHLDPSTRGRAVERVILVEKDPRVCNMWDRLLMMDPDDLAKYPIPKAGERTDDFLLMTSACSNRIARTESMIVTTRMPVVIERMFRRIALVLPHAKGRVEVIHGDYTKAPDIEATWFIDPPYQISGRARAGTDRPQGMGYARDCDSSTIDYAALATWCKARSGQVIVCEQSGATWLPFQHLRWARDSLGNKASEVVWLNTPTEAPGTLGLVEETTPAGEPPLTPIAAGSAA